MNLSAYGFDPGLRHGSMVYLEVDINDTEVSLVSFKEIFTWEATKKSKVGLGKDSDIVEIQTLSTLILNKMNEPAPICGIEWDSNSVYWRAQKVQVVTLGMFLGYFIRSMNERAIATAILRPYTIRSFFGINQKAKKEGYMGFPLNAPGKSELPVPPEALENSDVYDAMMIAYLTIFTQELNV